MNKFVEDGLERIQKEIDDISNGNILDEEAKEKMLSILNKEKSMLLEIEKFYEDESTRNN